MTIVINKRKGASIKYVHRGGGGVTAIEYTPYKDYHFPYTKSVQGRAVVQKVIILSVYVLLDGP